MTNVQDIVDKVQGKNAKDEQDKVRSLLTTKIVVDMTDRYSGLRYKGEFDFTIPNLQQRLEIELTEANLAQNNDGLSIHGHEITRSMAWIYNTTKPEDRPEWLDPKVIYDPQVIFDIFAQMMKFLSSFREGHGEPGKDQSAR